MFADKRILFLFFVAVATRLQVLHVSSFNGGRSLHLDRNPGSPKERKSMAVPAAVASQAEPNDWHRSGTSIALSFPMIARFSLA